MRDIQRLPSAAMLRAKVVLTAIALAAAVVLVAVAWWPVKILALLVFVRGMFAVDIIADRAAARQLR